METKEQICEHELNLIFEHWMGTQSVMIILECQKCKARFEGLVVKI